jgi:hypothetical protein
MTTGAEIEATRAAYRVCAQSHASRRRSGLGLTLQVCSVSLVIPALGWSDTGSAPTHNAAPQAAHEFCSRCDDQHGEGNGDAFCQADQGVTAFQGLTDGTQLGLNPGLSANADTTVHRLVKAIKESPVWREGGYSAIVVVYDENDYSGLAAPIAPNKAYPVPNQNLVVLTVETNARFRKSSGGVHSKTFYTSYSLLKSMEAGFRLPCLNHACDKGVNVMTDLFGNGGW